VSTRQHGSSSEYKALQARLRDELRLLLNGMRQWNKASCEALDQPPRRVRAATPLQVSIVATPATATITTTIPNSSTGE